MLAESAADCEVYFYHSPPRSTEMLLSPHWHPDGQVYDAQYILLRLTGLSVLSASTSTYFRSVHNYIRRSTSNFPSKVNFLLLNHTSSKTLTVIIKPQYPPGPNLLPLIVDPKIKSLEPCLPSLASNDH